MSLKDKITSKEQLLQEVTIRYYDSYQQELASKVSFVGSSVPTKIQWWAIREQARITNGIYEMTDALTILNQHRQVFAHVSSEDRNMVAFTPDAVFGAADRQLRISFAKLVARLIPFAADDYIRDLNAWHLSELSNEVEWIEGLDIASAYANDTNVGACMSAKSNFVVQPTVVYATAGVKMAVVRDKAGNLTARAMVVENKDKKVYIRAYGNPVLKKRLERLGYKVGTWEGVEFNTVFLTYATGNQTEDGKYKVVIPYLDGNGSTCHTEYSSVALIDEKLVCLPRSQHKRFRQVGGTLAVPSTAGYVELQNLSSTAFQHEDYFSKQIINTLFKDYARIAVVDSESHVAKLYAFDDGDYVQWQEDVTDGVEGVDANRYPLDLVKARISIDRNYTRLFVSKADTFEYRYDLYVDDAATREDLGFSKLSKTYYPEESGWVQGTVKVAVDGVIHKIRSEDCVSVVMKAEDGVEFVKKMHKSSVTKDMTRLHNYGKDKGYVAKDVEFFRTPSGSKVHKLFNRNIAQTFMGYDFDRNVKRSESVLGVPIFISKGTDLTSPEYVKHCEAVFERAFTEKLDTATGNLVKAAYLLCDLDHYHRIWPSPGNTAFTRSVYMSDAYSNVLGPKAVTEYLNDAKAVAQNNKWKRKAIERLNVMMAEACALEEPISVQHKAPEQVTPKVVTASFDENFALAA